MNVEKFANISIRGRIAYVILCFENYIKVKYTDVDMQLVLVKIIYLYLILVKLI